MLFNEHQLQDLTQQAVNAARAAGSVIDTYRQTQLDVQYKDVGNSLASQVVTQVDREAQTVILQLLQSSCEQYDLALLTEESPDDGQRHKKKAFWCIDPLDGTLAFINNQPGFSVSIALVSQEGESLIGVVYDPLEQVLFHAAYHQGAFKNGDAIIIPAVDPGLPLILQTDTSFQTHAWFERTRVSLVTIARQLGLNSAALQYRTGAVLNACSILEQPNCCYFKYPRIDNSGGSLWDYAATACLFHEAGAIATDIHGQAMDLNRSGSTFMNHQGLLYAADQSLAEHIYSLYQNLIASTAAE